MTSARITWAYWLTFAAYLTCAIVATVVGLSA